MMEEHVYFHLPSESKKELLFRWCIELGTGRPADQKTFENACGAS